MATNATAAPSGTGVSTLTTHPAADTTIDAAASTAAQTRVAVLIQLEKDNGTRLRLHATLATTDQAETTSPEGQVAQPERDRSTRACSGFARSQAGRPGPEKRCPRRHSQATPGHPCATGGPKLLQWSTSISIAPSPPSVPACTGPINAGVAIYIAPPAPSVPACNGPTNGYRNLYCTALLSEPARTGPTNGYRNLYCTTPPQDQPVPALPTGTAISIVPSPTSVSACTSPISGYGGPYCAAPPPIPTCSNLVDGSSNKIAGFQ